MKKGLLGGVAAIALVAAAGASGPGAAAQQAYDWTGFYLGAHLGYGDADYRGAREVTSASSLSFYDDLDLDGVAGGFHGGYNYQGPAIEGVGDIVLGVEADVTLLDWSDTILDTIEPSNGISGDVDLLWSIRARLGVAVDRVLVYATAGIAFADADFTVISSEASPDGTDFNDVGGVFGGGVEWAVTDLIAVRAEGLYYLFDESIDAKDFGETSQSGDFAEFDDAFVFRVGVTFNFDSFLSGNTRKTAGNVSHAGASKMASKKMAPKKVSQAKSLARERKPRTEDDAVASRMAPTLISQVSPLARAPKPRTEVVAPAPPREPPRTVLPESTGLDTETRLVKLKTLYDKGLISDRDYYEKRRQLSLGMSAARDDLKAAAVQVGPEKKPGDQEPAVKPDDEMVKIVFATPGPRGGEADRGSREYVMWVQRSLNQILGMDLDVDGVMGRQTRGAVRSFQTEAGLGVDGTPGPRTEDALIKAGASPPRPG